MPAYAIDAWDSFFAAQAGAAAALVGLLFVGLSLNLKDVLRYPALPGRAAETILVLSNMVIVSTYGLIPGQTRVVAGAEILSTGIVAWLIWFSIQYRGRHIDIPARTRAFRITFCQAAILPVIVAGFSVIVGAGGGLYWLVPGFISAFITSIINTWVFLIEIER